jgi:hypothetical protein
VKTLAGARMETHHPPTTLAPGTTRAVSSRKPSSAYSLRYSAVVRPSSLARFRRAKNARPAAVDLVGAEIFPPHLSAETRHAKSQLPTSG